MCNVYPPSFYLLILTLWAVGLDLASHMWEKYGQSLLTLWGASLVLGVSCGVSVCVGCGLCAGLHCPRLVCVCVLVPVLARGWVTVFMKTESLP